MAIPYLPDSVNAPLLSLEKIILDKQNTIESWFRSQWHHHDTPFYGSVDLRNSGFKLAPIDMNLFPGGFNNLNPDSMPVAVTAAHPTTVTAVLSRQNLTDRPAGERQDLPRVTFGRFQVFRIGFGDPGLKIFELVLRF